MTEKKIQKSEINNVNITNIINGRPGDISDATRLYRKEEILKKKLKNILEINAGLEKEIKLHENQINDERASIQFQLSDLHKEMGLKFGCFVDQKLERQNFLNNNSAHQSMQNMMRKYQQIQKECSMLQKIFESLQKINNNYQTHGNEMQDLVLNFEKVNQEYETTMENTLNTINEQIKAQIYANQQTQIRTQSLVKDIDDFVIGTEEFKQEQQKVLAKVERLKKMVHCQQEKVDEIQQWQEIVIDKSNRKALYRTIQEKQAYLQRLQSKNNQLQIYLSQLDNQLQIHILSSHKENNLIEHKSAIKTQKSLTIKNKSRK